MASLNILSGGAAHGLVKCLAPAFKLATGLDIEGRFGAVGAMADELRAGSPIDLIILTRTLVGVLANEQLIAPSSIRNVGLVETALAVRAHDPKISVSDWAALCEALLAADAIYVPDTKASTAGTHFARILDQLAIQGEVESRLKIYPNGATAMRRLAESPAMQPLGCTQATEIIDTPGVVLSGPLPPGYELASMYTAAITTRTTRPREARTLIDLLVAADRHELRYRVGFVESTENGRRRAGEPS